MATPTGSPLPVSAARGPGPRPVALVTGAFHPFVGGVETHVAELAQHLAAAGREAVVLTQAPDAVIAEHGARQERDGYRIERYRQPLAATNELPAPRLFAAVARYAAAGWLVHAHNYHALAFAGAALRTPPGSLVLTPHYHGVGRTGLRTAAHRGYRLLGRRVMRRAAAVVAVSAAEADLLAADFGPRVAARTRVVPNGARVLPGTPRELPGPTVFTWGRLEPYKNIDVLIRAVGALPPSPVPSQPPVQLVIAGDGPARSALEELAARVAPGRVRFLGRVSDADLGDWLASDVLVAATSSIEAFGLTLADALASGRPVAASDIAAHRAVADLAGDAARVRWLPVTETTHTRTSSHDDADPLVARVATVLDAALADRTPTGQLAPSTATGLASWAQVTGTTGALYDDLA